MARKTEMLDAITVQKTTKPGLFGDGGGLYLQVTEHGLKTWVFRFMLNGKRRDMGLGRAGNRDVTLAEARGKAAEARKLVKAGIDPIEATKADKAARLAEAAKAKTFTECAEAYMASHEAGWRNTKHAQQWKNTLAAYAYPTLGSLPVNMVDTGLVMAVIEPLWKDKNETASRLRGRIESILDWARTSGYRDGDNPARWKGHLDQLLPKRAKVRAVTHHAALSYEDIGAFMSALRQLEGSSAKGLEFLILTATRTGEVIGAKWSEFDLDRKVWTIPAERMKAGKEHRVPLSPAALAVLNSVATLPHGEYVFPGAKEKRPLSNMAFLMTLRRMKRPDLTAHGFRSTFRDWIAERTSFRSEVAEAALAHTIDSKVEAAYRRGDLFEKRRQLMERWAEYCGTVRRVSERANNVVALGRAG